MSIYIYSIHYFLNKDRATIYIRLARLYVFLFSVFKTNTNKELKTPKISPNTLVMANISELITHSYN